MIRYSCPQLTTCYRRWQSRQWPSSSGKWTPRPSLSLSPPFHVFRVNEDTKGVDNRRRETTMTVLNKIVWKTHGIHRKHNKRTVNTCEHPQNWVKVNRRDDWQRLVFTGLAGRWHHSLTCWCCCCLHMEVWHFSASAIERTVRTDAVRTICSWRSPCSQVWATL